MKTTRQGYPVKKVQKANRPIPKGRAMKGVKTKGKMLARVTPKKMKS